MNEIISKPLSSKLKKRHFLIPLGLIFLAAVLIMIISTTSYAKKFLATSGLKSESVLREARQGMRSGYKQDYLTILILGLDQRLDDNSLLTDTILLAAINAKTGNYALFSIPRDLWIPDFKTKINSLYYYGKKQDPNDGTELVKLTLESIFDWKINHVVILKMDQIQKLISLVGGIEVDVERSFTDEQFPKDDGTGQVKTISFAKGTQAMNGEKALQYMRSRKSTDLVEGTDEARQKRQKVVFLALKEKLISKSIVINRPEILGEIYKFFTNEVEINPKLSLETIFSYWKVGQSIFLSGTQTEYDFPWKGEEPILINDRDPTYGSWILKPIDNQWELIKDYFHKNLP